jgi:hypothetical protein
LAHVEDHRVDAGGAIIANIRRNFFSAADEAAPLPRRDLLFVVEQRTFERDADFFSDRKPGQVL